MKTIFLSFSIANTSVSDYFIELSNKLSEEFRVIIITDSVKDHQIPISFKIEIFKWPSRRPTKWKDFKFLIQKVKEYRPDMMISMFGSINIFLVVGYLFGVKYRIPWARTISTQFQTKKNLLIRKKILYKLATKVIANSNATKRDLRENFGVRDSKIEVCYNAVKEYPLENHQVQRNKILYVGNMWPSKGVDTLLEAMPAVLKKFPEIKLTLIGGSLKGSRIKQLQKKAVEFNISKNVVFAGSQSKERVLKEFSSAYLAVVPSVVEAFGFVLIESFSVKTPVIGSNTSGIAEIIRDGKDGFLFEPKNEVDLSEKILKLLKDEGLRQEFSKNCYARFKEEFEVESATTIVFEKLKQL
ncbi:hypothetical protein GCM10007103_33850 [Salinimicrobium marinum]|uniref:Uncharacterized protein n=1 Tax=Salinimicrobium marinum TaxID=680283 RepID=A0A918SN78_9FLAO|nr:glycosyltransferase family 4 protein [Salinimicrobium marinum]GHA50337.1 hypothetical protein GCM10007103_33850 [Salinimicrobium marinum]